MTIRKPKKNTKLEQLLRKIDERNPRLMPIIRKEAFYFSIFMSSFLASFAYGSIIGYALFYPWPAVLYLIPATILYVAFYKTVLRKWTNKDSIRLIPGVMHPKTNAA